MSDILIVPTFDRAEMLYHCLQNLSRAEGSDLLEWRICVDDHPDRHYDPSVHEVLEMTFEGRPVATVTFRGAHSGWGNSRNLLTAYQDAYESDAEYVFMVEDDVMVARDFFLWSYRAHREHNPFVTIGCIKLPADAPYIDKEWFGPGYASLAVCFKRENLRPILDHREAFLKVAETQSFKQYYLEHFPGSRYNQGQWGGQDGLINRVMEKLGVRACLPGKPRAFHAGYYGYNRSMERRPNGTLTERIAEVGRIMASRAELTRDYKDCEPCEL